MKDYHKKLYFWTAFRQYNAPIVKNITTVSKKKNILGHTEASEKRKNGKDCMTLLSARVPVETGQLWQYFIIGWGFLVVCYCFYSFFSFYFFFKGKN